MSTAVINTIPRSMLTDDHDHVLAVVSESSTSPSSTASPRATCRDGHGPHRAWTTLTPAACAPAACAGSTVRHDVKVPGPSGLKGGPAGPSSYENEEYDRGARAEDYGRASPSTRCDPPTAEGLVAHRHTSDESARQRLIGCVHCGHGQGAPQDLLPDEMERLRALRSPRTTSAAREHCRCAARSSAIGG